MSEPKVHYMTAIGIASPWVSLELAVLDRCGIAFELHGLRRHGGSFYKSEWARDLDSRTRWLYPAWVPGFVLSVLVAPFLFRRRFLSALVNALFGEREHIRARAAGLVHLAVACHWARQVRGSAAHVHAQWAHACATVGMYGAWLLGSPFSFTGHAADLFRDRCALRDKVRRARFIACISEFHRDFYLEEGARPEQLLTVHCGLDVDGFSAGECRADTEVHQELRLISSGRLVEKKGFADLIAACGLLRDRGVPVRCRIVGNGPLRTDLARRAKALGLEGRVHVTGEQISYEEVPAFMRSGDVYALPCVWAGDGDVDGLPAVLFEAMASGLPVVSTRLAGIPDLVRDGETGLLVEPGDVSGLADAIERLWKDGVLRRRLAEAGRRRVVEHFNLSSCVEPLVRRFRAALEEGAGKEGASRAATVESL